MYFRSQRKLQGEVSLSESIETDKEGNALQLMDVVGVDDTMLDDIHDRDSALRLRRLICEKLTPREAEIVRLRYGLGGTVPLTQREIATSFGISRSYVSQRRYCKRFSPKEKRLKTAQSLANTGVMPAVPVPGTGSAE